MKIIIVRHGETEDNVKRIVQGQRQGKLTKKGVEQAKKLAQRLKDEKIDVIFSSDLQRAKDTTKEIAKFHKVTIYYTSELREISFGVYQGKPYESYWDDFHRSGYSIIDFKPEKGENTIELKERLQKFLDKLLKEYKGKIVLISAHGRVNRMLLAILFNIPLELAVELQQYNTCVNIIEVSEKENKAHLVNCIKHL
jgi:broad specificity phosphatase PhoE